jgi:hypothetical protein
MAKSTSSEKVIVVAGDLTVDWNLVRTEGRAGGLAWSALDCTRAGCQPGGAAMLAELIKTAAQEISRRGREKITVRHAAIDWPKVLPTDEAFHHSYALWSLYEKNLHDPEKTVWRVKEFLGLDHCTLTTPQEDLTPEASGDSPPALVVLDDANLGFRTHRRSWPQALTQQTPAPWIILKMASPIAQGPLWEELYRQHADRLIVVIPVKDLRLTEVQISRDLSWERTAQDLFWELTHNLRISGLSQCAHVVISLNAAGALLLSKTPSGPRGTLIFDHRAMEGAWEARHPGSLIGYTICLTAGIAREIMLSRKSPDLPKGIQAGLTALRSLHVGGYDSAPLGPGKAVPTLVFPYKRVTAALTEDGDRWEVSDIPLPLQPDPLPFTWKEPSLTGPWNILQDKYPDNLPQVARKIVLQGVKEALPGVPLGEFGGLVTVDRLEIESLRSIRILMREYCCHPRHTKPISIAVFGPPGSGKSFAIKQIAKSFSQLPTPIEPKEFNLSQFNDPEELLGALHQVRDVSLSGKMPLVFWDEFDTALGGNSLGWLRSFLSPMQDGTFQEGQITHPLGRAIFVFAGGTSATVEAFSRVLPPEDFRAVKGPDFVSRLRGYVNILGPNRQTGEGGLTVNDPHFIIRRAIILRVMLKLHWEALFRKENDIDLLHIDPGVLHAFLEASRYKHGARSMEAVITMSALTHKTHFERSSLPSEAQLDLHVDGREFLSLVQTIILPEEMVDTLAEAVHLLYCDKIHATGKHSARRTCCKTYKALDPEDKEQNRAFVRDIPHKLAQVGYQIIPARGRPRTPDLTEVIENLAEAEHLRWLKAKIEQGWRQGPTTDKARKVHQAMLWWHKLSKLEKARLPAEWLKALGKGALPEDEKEKNRDLVRKIPEILIRAGFSLVGALAP